MSASIFAFLFSCAHTIKGGQHEDGGHIHHKNEKKTKKINDTRIKSFKASFGLERFCNYPDIYDGLYRFTINKDNEGNITLTSKDKWEHTCRVQQDVLDGIQEIIESNSLASLNGTTDYTEGLPIPVAVFNAVYESGEKLSFCINSDNFTDAGTDIAFYMHKVLMKHGLHDIATPDSLYKLNRMHIKYDKGNGSVEYDVAIAKGGKRKLIRISGEKGWKEAEIPEGFFENLSEIIEDNGLRWYLNNESGLGRKNGDGKPVPYYYVYGELKDKDNRYHGYFEGKNISEKFLTRIRPVIDLYEDAFK